MSRLQPLLLIGLLWSGVIFAAQQEEFDPETRAHYHALLEELRCLVCQNESLATSNADLAEDLRLEVRQMIARGMSNQAIADYMVARYGDFVLYRPPIKPTTYALWFLPLILLVIALAVLGYEIRRRANRSSEPLTPREQSRLRQLLAGSDKPDDEP